MYLIKIEANNVVTERFILTDLDVSRLAIVAVKSRSFDGFNRDLVFAKLVEASLDVQTQEAFEIDLCFAEFDAGPFSVSLQAKPPEATVWGV